MMEDSFNKYNQNSENKLTVWDAQDLDMILGQFNSEIREISEEYGPSAVRLLNSFLVPFLEEYKNFHEDLKNEKRELGIHS